MTKQNIEKMSDIILSTLWASIGKASAVRVAKKLYEAGYRIPDDEEEDEEQIKIARSNAVGLGLIPSDPVDEKLRELIKIELIAKCPFVDNCERQCTPTDQEDCYGQHADAILILLSAPSKEEKG